MEKRYSWMFLSWEIWSLSRLLMKICWKQSLHSKLWEYQSCFACNDQFSRFVDGRYSDNLEKNDYVEIISGRFAGVRGYYARPFKDKCVVCVVEGLAVCTTYIPAYALKIIEKGK